MKPEERFIIPQEVYEFVSDVVSRGESYGADWAAKLHRYEQQYLQEAAEFRLRVEAKFPQDWRRVIPNKESHLTEPTASRKSAGIVGG